MRNPYIVSITMLAASLLAMLSLAPLTAHGQQKAAKAKDKGAPYPRQLALFDRQGKSLGTVGEPDNFMNPVLSPDGTKVAVVRTGSRSVSENAVGGDIWVFDISTGAATRITSDLETGKKAPVWSPDGSQIVYFSFRGDFGGLYRKPSNGTGSEELLFTERGVDMPLTDWSPDGRFLSFDAGSALWAVPVNGERKSIELLREEFSVHGARFSPDGRFLAYLSYESGQMEVYVQALDPSSGLPSGGGKWRISSQGGFGLIQWRQDGRELYYLAADGGLMAVEVTTTRGFAASPPKLLFQSPAAFDFAETNDATTGGDCSCDIDACEQASISRDGQRFVFAVPTSGPREAVTVAPGILAKYSGSYVVIPEGPEGERGIVITVEGSQLRMQDGARTVTLAALSDAKFFQGNWALEFIQDDKSVVTHLILHRGVFVDRAARK